MIHFIAPSHACEGTRVEGYRRLRGDSVDHRSHCIYNNVRVPVEQILVRERSPSTRRVLSSSFPEADLYGRTTVSLSLRACARSSISSAVRSLWKPAVSSQPEVWVSPPLPPQRQYWRQTAAMFFHNQVHVEEGASPEGVRITV